MPKRLSADKIKARMTALGIGRVQLIDRTGLSESTVDRALHNRATNYSDFTVNRFAIALECPVLELYDDESTSAALTAFTVHSVEGVVEKAIVENVTAVVENVAPDVPPEAVAESVPNTPVSIPSEMDVANYFDYIQRQHKSEIDGMTAAYEKHMSDLRRDCATWICIGIGSLVVSLVVCCMCIVAMVRG